MTTYQVNVPANVEWFDTGISVNRGQALNMRASGFVTLNYYHPIWNSPDGRHDLSDNTREICPSAAFMALVGKIGSRGTPFPVGSSYSAGASTTGRLYLAVNDLTGTFGDNLGSFNVMVSDQSLSERTATANTGQNCDQGVHEGDQYFSSRLPGQTTGPFPINLRTGEKQEWVTDLALNTPAGELAFTRTFRQSKLETSPFLMGRGWSHNHHFVLKFVPTDQTVIWATLPDGGEAEFKYDVTTQKFQAVAGGTSSIATTGSGYQLKTDDQTFTYKGDKLQSRQWSSSEVWTYNYYSTTETAGKLKEVTDGYGRKLQFTYYTGLTGAHAHKNGQLWRVGDQTAENLDGNAPTGRYVTFDYQSDGGDAPKALLTSVTDVRGQTWTYQYTDRSNPHQRNFLKQINSPPLRKKSINRKMLRYTTSGSGKIERIDQFIGVDKVDADNSVNANLNYYYVFKDRDPQHAISSTARFNKTYHVTEEHHALASNQSLKTEHYFDGGVYVGSKDATDHVHGQQVADSYRPLDYQDGLGHRTQMEWSANGKTLNKVKDALQNETLFSYDNKARLTSTTDALGRRTEYTYDDTKRQPTAIKVWDGTTVLRWQTFRYDDKGRVTEEKLLDPADKAGATALQTTTRTYWTAKDENGLLKSVKQTDHQDAKNTTTLSYTYDSAGRVIKTQKSSLLGSCQFTYTVYDAAGNVLATVCGRESATIPTTVAAARALYDATDPTKFTVTTHSYDTLGRRITTTTHAAAPHEQTTYTMYDSADRVTHEIANYVPQGTSDPAAWVWSTANNRWEVEPVSKGVPTPAPVSHGTDKNENQITYTEYNSLGQLRFQRDPLGNVTLYGYDEAGRLLKTIQNASNEKYDNHFHTKTADPSLAKYPEPPPAPTDQDIITITVYDGNGNLIGQADASGQTQFTLYDGLNRPIKTVRNLKKGADIKRKSRDPGYVVANDPASDAYVPNHGAVDEDLIDVTTYDANGNVNGQVDASGQTQFTLYDGLNRPIKTVRNFKAEANIALNPGDPGYVAANDLRSEDYVPSPEPDRDLIEYTDYDARGHVSTTYRLLENRIDKNKDGQLNHPDQEWDTTLYGYDGLGRQVKVIQHASQPLYRRTKTSDPSMAAYVASTDPDQDLMEGKVYNAEGQVESVWRLVDNPTTDRDKWHWDVTRYVYDRAGRQVKEIRNYKPQGTSDPADWVWSETNSRWEVKPVSADVPTPAAVSHGDGNDQNTITHTSYDAAGRVQQTRDDLGRLTHMVYDSGGRVIREIANYLPQGISDPADWVWSMANNRWEYSSGQAVAHGTDNDQNIISQTIYEAGGRVQQRIDNQHKVIYYVYDRLGRNIKTIHNYLPQGTSDPAAWVWSAANSRWEHSPGQVVAHGTEHDQNQITTTDYNRVGWVMATRDAAGNETLYFYDRLGQRTKTIRNYGSSETASDATNEDEGDGQEPDPVDTHIPPGLWDWNMDKNRWEISEGHGNNNDQNLMTRTYTNVKARAVLTVDAGGKQTAIYNDLAGRPYLTAHAFESDQQTITWTYYDKGGRVMGTADNWHKDAEFRHKKTPIRSPLNTLKIYSYDRASRQIKASHSAMGETTTTYFKDGQVASERGPDRWVEGNGVTQYTTAYRYDGLRRRNLVVQNYVPNDEDPSKWVWNASRYETSTGTPIDHGTDNDQNLIVQASYDLAGRMTSLRDPRGNRTTYEYDGLDRRTKHTNPLANEWSTAYTDLSSGGTQITQTYPGLDAGGSYDVTREFDRLGRLQKISYGDPANTPDVDFSYDAAGNRVSMAEYNNTRHVAANLKRKTTYSYDAARRLSSVGFDKDGNGTVDETLRYSYGPGGQRTHLQLPDGKTLRYAYDAKGRLIRLTDWAAQPRASWFYYNEAGQQTWALRPNGLWSEYDHRNDGYLWGVYHRPKFKRVLASFKSIVQPNGDRYSVDEDFIQYTTDTVTQRKSTPGVSFPKGSWTDTGDFKQTAKWGSVMEIAYTGERGWLAIGTGPNHGMIDISINGWFWRSFNGYEETIGEKVIEIPRVVTPEGETTGKVAIEVRSDNHHRSTGHVFRFKQLEGTRILSVRRPVPHTKVTYTYDGADRLQQADYEPGTDYDYDYDLAGNLTDNNGTARTYNAANQLTANGSRNLTYDANGNLTSDGVNTYTWDRANRLTQAGNTAYTYDGLGNRVSQTIDTAKTDYLLDVAADLPQVIAATTGTSTERYIHGPRGLHAKQAANGDWTYTLDDFLGSVRGWVDDDQQIVQTHSYDPYGHPTTPMTGFAFTGEMRDANGLQYHRARYYNPTLAGWLSLDPVQGDMGQPMSLNRYLYASGNPVMNTDPTGLFDTSTCTVEAGDYLEKIALQVGVYLGNGRAVGPTATASQRRAAWQRIAALNPHLKSPSRIFPGDRLRLPRNRAGACMGRRGGTGQSVRHTRVPPVDSGSWPSTGGSVRGGTGQSVRHTRVPPVDSGSWPSMGGGVGPVQIPTDILGELNPCSDNPPPTLSFTSPSTIPSETCRQACFASPCSFRSFEGFVIPPGENCYQGHNDTTQIYRNCVKVCEGIEVFKTRFFICGDLTVDDMISLGFDIASFIPGWGVLPAATACGNSIFQTLKNALVDGLSVDEAVNQVADTSGACISAGISIHNLKNVVNEIPLVGEVLTLRSMAVTILKGCTNIETGISTIK